MKRRRVLALASAGLSVIAGCSSRNLFASPTPSPAVESQVDVPPCPEKPAPLNRENAVRFAIQFEKAYVTRRILQEHERVTYVQFKTIAGVGDDPHAEVTKTDDGFLVRFGVTPAYGFQPKPGTPNTAHADPGH